MPVSCEQTTNIDIEYDTAYEKNFYFIYILFLHLHMIETWSNDEGLLEVKMKMYNKVTNKRISVVMIASLSCELYIWKQFNDIFV